MARATTLPPIKFRPVPRLLDHIGLAMYSNFNKAIAELVVNGYDADATHVAVEIDAKQILIRDDGGGMNEDDIRNLARTGRLVVLDSTRVRSAPPVSSGRADVVVTVRGRPTVAKTVISDAALSTDLATMGQGA